MMAESQPLSVARRKGRVSARGATRAGSQRREVTPLQKMKKARRLDNVILVGEDRRRYASF